MSTTTTRVAERRDLEGSNATLFVTSAPERRNKLLDKLPHVANAIETGLDWLRRTSPTRSSSCLVGLAKLFTWSSCTLIGGISSYAGRHEYATHLHFKRESPNIILLIDDEASKAWTGPQ